MLYLLTPDLPALDRPSALEIRDWSSHQTFLCSGGFVGVPPGKELLRPGKAMLRTPRLDYFLLELHNRNRRSPISSVTRLNLPFVLLPRSTDRPRLAKGNSL